MEEIFKILITFLLFGGFSKFKWFLNLQNFHIFISKYLEKRTRHNDIVLKTLINYRGIIKQRKQCKISPCEIIIVPWILNLIFIIENGIQFFF